MVSSKALWLAPDPLVLASGSRTRRALLEAAGLSPRVEASSIDERRVEADLAAQGVPADQFADGLAREKALDVSRRCPAAWVIGADQTLRLGDKLFHKPAGAEEARRQLQALMGRTHVLRSAFAVAFRGRIEADDAAEAHLTIRVLSDSALDAVIAAMGSGVTQSVGGYQVEGPGIHLFERIEGDHTTILGLPLLPLFHHLRHLGVLAS
jgi:septum formation protein